jgi:hypothetical protein
MAVPTLPEFLDRFPELAVHTHAQLEQALATAGRRCDENVWDNLHGDGVGLFAAHLIACRVREVGAQVGQAAPSAGSGLEATHYGQQFAELQSCLPLTCGFAI